MVETTNLATVPWLLGTFDTAGEVLMSELRTSECEQRREKISPLRVMEALSVGRFSRICDFAGGVPTMLVYENSSGSIQVLTHQ
jgi:hypothetical protein